MIRSTRVLTNLVIRLTSLQASNGCRHAFNILRTKECNAVFNKFVHSNTKPVEHNNEEIEKKEVLGTLEKKLKLVFTCLKCKSRNYKLISKQAYEKGVVIARCDGCKNNHLIADNLGWFPSNKEYKNIEQILKAKGEKVRRIRNDEEGYFEAIQEVEFEERMKELNKRSNMNLNCESNISTLTNETRNNTNAMHNSTGSITNTVTKSTNNKGEQSNVHCEEVSVTEKS